MKFNHSIKTISIILLALFASGLSAEESVPYHYFDGDKKITVYLQPDLIAEFRASAAATKQSHVKSALPASRAVNANAYLAIFRVSSEAARTALRGGTVPDALKGGPVSPVFTTGSAGGSMRALPGGVIVSLNPAWSAKTVAAWVAARGLTIKQRLNITGNFYALNTDAGMASLIKANELRALPDVLSATPNWWMEYSHR